MKDNASFKESKTLTSHITRAENLAYAPPPLFLATHVSYLAKPPRSVASI